MFRRLAALAVTGCLFLASLWPVSAQARSVLWQRWDVDITNVDTGANRFDVAETHQVAFTGTFRFGSRVIALNNLEDIRDVQVFEAGQPLEASCSTLPGTYCVSNTEEGKSIVYNFRQPITNSQQIFRIEYRVIGALRSYEGGDQLWWQAIPSEHYGFSIAASEIRVTLPPSFTPREGVDPIATYGVPAQTEMKNNTVIARATRPITGSESFELRVQYPHDPNGRMPTWQGSFDQQRRFGPIFDLAALAGSIAILLGGALLVYVIWYRRGRDPKVGPAPEYLTAPPSDLPPAIVGTLLDEHADMRDIIATVIDLARRGYLVLEEEKKSGLLGIGRHSEFTFKRTEKPLSDLRPYERRVLNGIFSDDITGSVVSLRSLRNNFYTEIRPIQDALYSELVSENLFTLSPSKTRMTWAGIGSMLIGITIIGSIVLFAASRSSLGSAIVCVPLAVVAVGGFFALVSRHMPAKTRRGTEEAAKWRAFRSYLANLERYTTIEETATHFDEYLPYAIAFDIERSWVRRFSQVNTVGIPTWYYPTYLGEPYSAGYTAEGRPQRESGSEWIGSSPVSEGELARAGDGDFSLDSFSGNVAFSLESISDGLTTMLESAARTMSSNPSSSGGGWSGGGSSGGGSSGGGSAGFG